MHQMIRWYKLKMLQGLNISLYSNIFVYIFLKKWTSNLNLKQIVFFSMYGICFKNCLRNVLLFFLLKQTAICMGPVIGWNNVLGLLEQINADVYSGFLMEVCLKGNSNIHFLFFRTSRFSTSTFYLISFHISL